MFYDDRYERAVAKTGGIFLLSALLQKRIRELVRGERPLVVCESKRLTDIVLQEVLEGKIEAEMVAPEGPIDLEERLKKAAAESK